MKSKKDRGSAFAFGTPYIIAASAMKTQNGIAFKPATPLFYIGNGFTKNFVIGNSHMNRVNNALAHLPKDSF
mgnify:CR=1 FL=1